jgi:membrane protease YdiL (CAAX protease family)
LDSVTQIPASLFVIGAFLVASSLFVYGRLVQRIAREGGKVRVDNFGLPDFMLATVLLTYFFLMIVIGFRAAPKPLHTTDIVNGSVLYVIVVIFLGSFMNFRGISLLTQFGVRRMKFGRVFGTALGLIAAAFPVVLSANVLTQIAMGSEAKLQEPVKFFQEASQKSDSAALLLMGLTAVIIAPFAEEFIFRGYFYGILKRRFGIFVGIALNAALFAAIHLNESSLPALFVLAICFTIAYEVTGSILVNMCMHGLFNLTSLILLLLAGHYHLP